MSISRSHDYDEDLSDRALFDGLVGTVLRQTFAKLGNNRFQQDYVIKVGERRALQERRIVG